MPLAEPEDQDPVQPGYLGPTPPVGQLPPRGKRLWVDRMELLLRAVGILTKANVVAIDAEFTQVRSRAQNDVVTTVPRLALLQLAVDQHCFVVAAMLQRAFHMRLDKSLQRTDWTRRPLPPAMVAYAARDAEVTLALYHWLDEHYHNILQLHENTNQPDHVAPWIEPFLRGTAPLSPEMAVAEAKAQGIIKNKAQIYADCRAALATLTHPMRRSRLLRLIADLSLDQMAPDIIPLLQASTSDERAGSARTLGRLGIKSARDAISYVT